MDLLLFVLAVAGMTNIVVESKMFAPVRDFLKEAMPPNVYEVFECFTCSGFWCGLICSVFTWGFSFSYMVLGAFAGSIIATIFYLFVQYVESNIDFSFEDETPEQKPEDISEQEPV